MHRNLRTTIAAAAVVFSLAGAAQAQRNPRVGGADMLPTKTIVENASASADHTTLVKAVTAAGLADTLSAPGPLTVFAPTNVAFAKLPPGTVDQLVAPENKAQLTTVLTYHVIPGAIMAKDIAAKAKAEGGTATYTTVQGGTLKFAKSGSRYTVTDGKGGTARITIPDVRQSNGVVHVVDTVLMPQ